MSAAKIKRACIRGAYSSVLGVLLLLCVPSQPAGASPQHGSIRDLERRARLAQALAEQVQTMQAQINELQEAMQSAQTTIEEQSQKIQQQENRIEEQNRKIDEQKREINNRDVMLRLFRSGDFEYYQVAEGDTLVSIASNPMVYGDERRAVWLAYANALDEAAPLHAGTVIIIPRFAEGVHYDF